MHQGTSNQIMQHTVPRTLTHIQAKEADIEAIDELTCALDKKEALVFELRRMNDDVLENVGEIVGETVMADVIHPGLPVAIRSNVQIWNVPPS
ncbi:hypothetical protein Tco_1331891 [Tanacetum coccineum]